MVSNFVQSNVTVDAIKADYTMSVIDIKQPVITYDHRSNHISAYSVMVSTWLYQYDTAEIQTRGSALKPTIHVWSVLTVLPKSVNALQHYTIIVFHGSPHFTES